MDAKHSASFLKNWEWFKLSVYADAIEEVRDETEL